MDLTKTTIAGLLQLFDKRQCSSEEAVSELLKIIKQQDSDIGAYISIDEDYSLRQAKEADRKRDAGNKGKLLGVPVAIKDVLNVKGQPCTCGSKILKGYTALYDATVIARLREEGAVFLGRTNMDEFAMGSSSENSSYHVTRNPCNRDYVAGGSSGGSAAAVASGEAICALGTDTGGSVRQPASFCGCVGLKPSYGCVSRYGLTAYASSLEQVGPITKTVSDAAYLLQIIAGKDEMDSSSVDTGFTDYNKSLRNDLKGMRLGLPKEYFVSGLDEDVRRNIEKAIDKCRTLGAEIVDVSLPSTEYAIPAYYIIATAEASANLARFDGVRYGLRAAGSSDLMDMYCKTREQGFGDEVKRRIIFGTYVLSSGYYDAYYLSAQKVRTLIRRDFDEAFRKCDALLSPVAPIPPFKFGEKSNPLQMYLSDIYTVTANLAGICGMSVPCGMTRSGLPIGLQILGPAFKEENIISVGNAFEKAHQ